MAARRSLDAKPPPATQHRVPANQCRRSVAVWSSVHFAERVLRRSRGVCAASPYRGACGGEASVSRSDYQRSVHFAERLPAASACRRTSGDATDSPPTVSGHQSYRILGSSTPYAMSATIFITTTRSEKVTVIAMMTGMSLF